MNGTAYHEARFKIEVRASLPVPDPADLEAVFEALEWRRLRLREDQQVPEWLL